MGESEYLAMDLELISDRFEMEMVDVLPILKKIQTFDPQGIAARDLQECLLLQIDQKEHPVSYSLVNEYFDDVANHRYEHLASKTGFSDEELKHALEVIGHLNPKPGAGHEGEETQSVIPELIIHERDNNWVIAVNDSWLPELQVSNEYIDMLAGELDKKAGLSSKKKWIVQNGLWMPYLNGEKHLQM